MSKKRSRGSPDETTTTMTTTEDARTPLPGELWRLVTDRPDIFESHVVTKLNGNDAKFFYDVNRESRRAMQRSKVRLPGAFKIGDFDTKSTLSWALEKCSENKKARFCAQMALNGNVELLEFLHEKGCPWDDYWTCRNAAENGHLECLKYAHEKGCPWDERTCTRAANYGRLECLKYAHENGCPWDWRTCCCAASNGQLECLKYAHENGCPWDGETCWRAAEHGHLECLRYAYDNGCPGSERYAHHLQ